mgnify:CR=1 FL=1
MAGVIFDFNGTLFEDADKQVAAWQAFALAHRGQALTAAEFDQHVHGQNNPMTLRYLLGCELSAEEVAAFSEDKEQRYRQLCREDQENFHLRVGAVAFFERLQQANIPMTIATASSPRNLDFFFEEFGLAQWFDRKQVVYDDGTLPSKPAPDAFLKAASKLGCASQHTVVFEDSLSGIAAAVAAGGQVVGVQTHGDQAPIARDPRLSAVIEAYTDSTPYLDPAFIKTL